MRSARSLLAFVAAGWLTAAPARADDVAACVASAERTQHLKAAARLVEARSAALACSNESCPALVRGDCQGWLEDIDRALPSVVVLARDGRGNDLTAVRVTIDGAVVFEKLDGRPMVLDPGEHAFRFERRDAAGGSPVEQRIVLGTGEKNRAVSIQLGESATTTPRPEAPSAPTPSRPVPTWTWLLGGASAAALATFAVFGVKAESENGRSKSACGHGACSQAELDTLHADADIADVALAVGVVAASVAAVGFFTRPVVVSDASGGPRGAQPAAVVRWGFAPGRHGGSASMSIAF